MKSRFLTNYTETSFLSTIQMNLRRCKSFDFSVSFIKKAGLVLLANDIKAALERGAKGRIITSTYQNFTDVESLNFFMSLTQFPHFECHLDDECFHDEKNYSTNGFYSKGYIFEMEDNRVEMVVGSSNITRYALLKNIEWDLVVDCERDTEAYLDAMAEFESYGTRLMNCLRTESRLMPPNSTLPLNAGIWIMIWLTLTSSPTICNAKRSEN